MSNNLDELLSQSEQAVATAGDLRALDEVRVQFLGKSGLFTER
ncbi:MAG: phenylalanine--tRNA ligase subunit alpha, partial [Chromatiaceae bacterium]|nr:phenylalanine--tRNA ligase subunit alpha [Chromatiaceae bacterium]